MSLRSSARVTKGRAAVSATFGGGVGLARSNIGSEARCRRAGRPTRRALRRRARGARSRSEWSGPHDGGHAAPARSSPFGDERAFRCRCSAHRRCSDATPTRRRIVCRREYSLADARLTRLRMVLLISYKSMNYVLRSRDDFLHNGRLRFIQGHRQAIVLPYLIAVFFSRFSH